MNTSGTFLKLFKTRVSSSYKRYIRVTLVKSIEGLLWDLKSPKVALSRLKLF